MISYWISTISVEQREGKPKIVSPLAEALDAAGWIGRLKSQGSSRNPDGTPQRLLKLFILDGDDPVSILSGITGVVSVPDFATRKTKDDPLLADPLLKAVAARNVALAKSAWDNQLDIASDIAKSLHPAWTTFEGRKSSPSGTFTDNFDGSGAGGLATELSEWTPSGGGAWTRIFGDGLSGRQFNAENDAMFCRAGSGGAAYICTDQGSANHYTQAKNLRLGNTSDNDPKLCVRLVDEENSIGWRQRGTGPGGLRLVETVAGVDDDTLVQFQGAVDEYYKIEASGSDIEIFKSTDAMSWTSQGSATSTAGQSETSQGVVGFVSIAGGWVDDFEAGALGGGGGGATIPIFHHHYNQMMAG